jgi:hypothetical protein
MHETDAAPQFDSVDEFDASSVFFNGGSSSALDGGSRGLMLAVLEEAIQCLAGDARATARRRRTREASRARQWILTRDPSSLFSFENICAALDLEADALREALLRKTEEGDMKAPASSHRVLRRRKNLQQNRTRGPSRASCG